MNSIDEVERLKGLRRTVAALTAPVAESDAATSSTPSAVLIDRRTRIERAGIFKDRRGQQLQRCQCTMHHKRTNNLESAEQGAKILSQLQTLATTCSIQLSGLSPFQDSLVYAAFRKSDFSPKESYNRLFLDLNTRNTTQIVVVIML